MADRLIRRDMVERGWSATCEIVILSTRNRDDPAVKALKTFLSTGPSVHRAVDELEWRATTK
jgi:hypothetical protein